jgi:DNA-binding MarR family transcriptional regulator
MRSDPKSPTASTGPQAETQAKEAAEGRFAYEGLDRVIHERARLSILTSLLTHPKGLTFNELKQFCSLTDGNLSRHLSILEKSGMVEVLKAHERNRPVTTCKVTGDGRKRYLDYLSTLEQVIRDAEKSGSAQPQARAGQLSPATS